jgi:hypothetical protein
MAPVVELLTSRHKSLNPIPNTGKKKEKKVKDTLQEVHMFPKDGD